MQVNRLSTGLQDQLKMASNFNTARSETLFDKEKYNVNDDGEIDFTSLNVEDLDITETQIANLLSGFAQEVINVFSDKYPDLAEDNPLVSKDSVNPQNQAAFTA